jgi:FMN phosphatase YigB (HAD superfamily)
VTRVRAVFFDVGETLICEDRIWRGWADWYGVPSLTFLGALGAVIERRAHHLDVFSYFDDDFDLDRVQAERAAAGTAYDFGPADLYADALPCLRALKEAGYLVGVAGNQPAHVTEAFFGSCGVALDVVASSAGWGVEKPDPAFFARVADAAGLPARAIAYVGDRVDNDVVPAAAAGLTAVFLRRGPWGYVHARWPEAAAAALRIESLTELPAALAALP